MRGTKSPEFIRARGSFRLDCGRIVGRKRVASSEKPYENAIFVLIPDANQDENHLRLAERRTLLQLSFQFGFMVVEIVAHVGDGERHLAVRGCLDDRLS